MNFLAMPTLKNVRACFLRPISMMPRFSLNVTLARLRTGIDSAGPLLRSAAAITMSATPMSFFSTAPLFFGFFRAMFFPYLFFLHARLGLFKTQSHLLCVFGLCSVLLLNFSRFAFHRRAGFPLRQRRQHGFCLVSRDSFRRRELLFVQNRRPRLHSIV